MFPSLFSKGQVTLPSKKTSSPGEHTVILYTSPWRRHVGAATSRAIVQRSSSHERDNFDCLTLYLGHTHSCGQQVKEDRTTSFHVKQSISKRSLIIMHGWTFNIFDWQ
jgi:hypothetical protein